MLQRVMPHSEVCMHMRVAGQRLEVELLPGRMVQLYKDGRKFSLPITSGEAGIYPHEWDELVRGQLRYRLATDIDYSLAEAQRDRDEFSLGLGEVDGH